jgi:AbrB family looped-hinge helix DNA binding protein
MKCKILRYGNYTYRIVIPAKIIKKLDIKNGDYLDIQLIDKKIVLEKSDENGATGRDLCRPGG